VIGLALRSTCSVPLVPRGPNGLLWPSGRIATVTADPSSPNYAERARAGEQLAAAPDLTEMSATLMALLLDPEDTYVTLTTADALLMRDDSAGLDLVLRAAARVIDSHVYVNHIYWLATAVSNYTFDRGVEEVEHRSDELRRRADELASAGDAELMAGVQALLS
jgi:hypothetical protein